MELAFVGTLIWATLAPGSLTGAAAATGRHGAGGLAGLSDYTTHDSAGRDALLGAGARGESSVGEDPIGRRADLPRARQRCCTKLRRVRATRRSGCLPSQSVVKLGGDRRSLPVILAGTEKLFFSERVDPSGIETWLGRLVPSFFGSEQRRRKAASRTPVDWNVETRLVALRLASRAGSGSSRIVLISLSWREFSMPLRCASLLILFLVATVARADNWPQWRGPDGNGVARGTSFPTTWTKDSNVLWRVPLPGRGASTPIVWQDRIFLTCGAEGQNTALCYDLAGKPVWSVKLGAERAGKHVKASGSNPSPVTDGNSVFVYFKSGELAALDMAGKVLWETNLQKTYGDDTLWWDLGTSPVLTDKHLVVACMHSGPSFLVAFDKATGKVAWKHDRNLDAPVEATQSYSTPVVVTDSKGVQTIYVLGADHVTAHAATDGHELWRVGGLNPEQNGYFRSIASPVIVGDVLIAPYARGNTITAIRLGGSGDVTQSHVLWTRKGIGSDVPTPTAVQGKLYVCTDRGEVACLDVATGNELWRERVEKNRNGFSASPILAGNKLYVTREDGTTFVLEQGEPFRVIATNPLDEFTVATPVFVNGKILLRTYDHLYCIGS